MDTGPSATWFFLSNQKTAKRMLRAPGPEKTFNYCNSNNYYPDHSFWKMLYPYIQTESVKTVRY